MAGVNVAFGRWTRLSQRVKWWLTIVVVSVMVVVLGTLTGFFADLGRAALFRLPTTSVGGGVAPYSGGPRSLEELILGSEVIVRARLLDTEQGVETVDYAGEEDDGTWVEGTVYGVTLEFRYEALEYLKGSGGKELVAVVDGEQYYETWLGARALSQDITGRHDTRWDDREAILFLREVPDTWRTKQADRGYMGILGAWDRNYGEFRLPAAAEQESGVAGQAEGGAAGTGQGLSGSDGQVFLGGTTLAELKRAVRESASAGDAAPATAAAILHGESKTITLGQLKQRMVELEAEASAGGSEEYRQCVYDGYERERYFTYTLSQKRLEARQLRTNHELASGLPTGTAFGWGDVANPPPQLLVVYPDYVPAWRGWLEGKNANLFEAKKGIIATARPMPAGEYTYYYNVQDSKHIICNAYPELRRTWNVHTVVVTAPEGTVHEAFFDPVALGTGGGADGTNGVLKPVDFTLNGVATGLQSLKWQNGGITLSLSAPVSLAGYGLEFIAQDGSVLLSLEAVDASESDGTLAWMAPQQPWHEGDLLMLRLRQSE